MAPILFVDDDEVERFYALEILKSGGHDVICAHDGAEAMEVYRRDGLRVDLVVTDLAMPRLNGLRLVRELKNLDPRVTIVAASGRNADQLDLAEDAGVDAILFKPWDPRQFLETVDQVLARRREALQRFPSWAFRTRTS